ncbi:PREDICTED: intraflagellar transport protein 80 homolog [Nicrophorus vespilloides]|uniref:Intraflagellar transport protein 80 homolog n=1 Tax=Nicrophorus vespilloides TaxID=110193 RepID=A0ABM1ML08_NICVS|nr:PREDICTED: intraflagellar transport protein 80 homolog [Nicrophorus vespilloides]
MKLKITLAKEAVHKAAVTCVGWSSTEEVYTAGDDNQLLSWNVSSNESTKIAQMGEELLPTDLQFLPRIGGSLGKLGDLILITSADGKFHVMNRSGRIERSVEAHKGAILVGQWSNDGASLLTGGEDGFIKVWSRGGMLRSSVVSSENSVYGASWAPDSQAIVYTQGRLLVIKQLAPNTKPVKWKAHEGLILCVSWGSSSEWIVSGGEDCKYRVWDGQGRPLYSSGLHDHPISSIAWCPGGDLFAIGSYNTLRLCDHSGWSRSLEKPATGSIYKLAWSSDGTQLAGACANGQVIFAHVVERSIEYANYTATVSERKTVTVHDVTTDTKEYLDVPERVIQLSMRYSHLVLTTPKQCYIYNSSNWNTPTIFDLKDGSVILLLQSEKNLLLVERSSVGLYNYQGRLIASPRWPNMRLEALKVQHISLSPDTLAVRDVSDPKTLHIIDLASNRNMSENVSTIQHAGFIIQLALDQSGTASERRVAVMDKNRDLFMVEVRDGHKTFQKLGGQIQSFKWNSDENMVAAVQDTRLIIWYCPSACFDRDILKLCSLQYDSHELGRSPRIHDFVGNSVSIRRADGSLLNVPISPFPSLLHSYIQSNKWTDALNLCRNINETSLWACLAVLATQSDTEALEIAEEAYAAINQYDKVLYIQHIKELSRPLQLAGAALLGGQIHHAESVLLHNGMVYYAILNHIKLHNWSRALELAVRHKTHIDTVLYLRQKYLSKLEKQEINKDFINLNKTINIDESKILERMELEKRKH